MHVSSITFGMWINIFIFSHIRSRIFIVSTFTSGLYLDTEEDNLRIEEIYDSVGDVRSVFVQKHFSADEESKVW